MFGFNIKNMIENQGAITVEEWNELVEDNIRLQDKIEELQKVINDYNDDCRKSNVLMDFSRIDAFSIERVIKDGIPYTNVGYILDGKSKEWCINCNETQHNELISTFRKHIANAPSR